MQAEVIINMGRSAVQALTEAIQAVAEAADANTADTTSVLAVAWDAMLAAGQAVRSPVADERAEAPLTAGQSARLALGELAAALRQAPSLPPVPEAAPPPGITDADAGQAGSYILFLAALLNDTLAEAAARAASPDDRTALYRAAAAARNLACCYGEGLRPGLIEVAAGVALRR